MRVYVLKFAYKAKIEPVKIFLKYLALLIKNRRQT